MQDFRSLKVWEKSHTWVLDVYRVTESFPKAEVYGLTSQLRRSAMSVPINIAEGCGRGSDKDLCRFLQISMGSASEAEYQLLLAHDLKYLPTSEYHRLHESVNEIKRMLTGLMQKIRSRIHNEPDA